ncbi:MAG: hypothetical protein ACRC6M_08140, partial [Microcystaceae cyanobacterium]
NDPNVLDSIPVGQLLQELVQAKPSIEQVTFSMYKLVKTLNRPKVYTGVAKAILDQLGPLYTTENQNELLDATIVEVEAMEDEGLGAEGHIQHPHVPTAFNQPFSPPVKETIIDPRVLAQRIAQILNQHPEQGRIKKLMFAVAKGNWENDAAQIDGYGFPKLVLELRQMFPTMGELKEGFDGIVQNINKATLYIAIANLILKKMADLYEDMSESLEDGQTGSHAATQIVQIRPANLALRQDAVPAHQATAIVEFGSQNASNEPLMTVLGSVPNPPSQQQPANTPKSYNLFEVRSEIMQYANPLRAKILLFSLLFNNWERNEDWSMLRSYSLDDLVEQVLLSRKSANDVETKLYGQAQSMSDREVYQQTAKTLIKVLKPLL